MSGVCVFCHGSKVGRGRVERWDRVRGRYATNCPRCLGTGETPDVPVYENKGDAA